MLAVALEVAVTMASLPAKGGLNFHRFRILQSESSQKFGQKIRKGFQIEIDLEFGIRTWE